MWLFMMPSYRQGEPSMAGKTAEDFAVTKDGRQARLRDFRGKLVLLNFWASYCGRVDANCGRYDDFLRKHPVAFQTVCEPANKGVSPDYGTVMIPETYVIDRQGRIDRKIIGPQQWDSPEMVAYFAAALTR